MLNQNELELIRISLHNEVSNIKNKTFDLDDFISDNIENQKEEVEELNKIINKINVLIK